jgi:deoxyadenosine/deoxycytidine kinase
MPANQPPQQESLRIAVVGPCAAGKSTLAEALRTAGYDVHQPAQEHSYVPEMWQRLTNPDLLIYLDVSYSQARERRPHNIDSQQLETQNQRLAHARQHCHFYLDTSGLTPTQVQERVLFFIEIGD